MMTLLLPALAEIPARLLERASALEGYSGPADRTFREAADTVKTLLERLAEERLSLEEAAAESGYTVGHLRRLLGLEAGFDPKIPNAGDEQEPRIQRGDLPRKPGHRTTPRITAPRLWPVEPASEPVLKVAPIEGRRASLKTQVARAVAMGGDV